MVIFLLAAGAYLSSLPLDSGDNYCGNVWVKRTTQGQFNGCDRRLSSQRLLVAELALGAGAVTMVLLSGRAGRRERRAAERGDPLPRA